MPAKTKAPEPAEQPIETIGRKWKRTRWGVHSRLIGATDRVWYGLNDIRSEEAALAEFQRRSGKQPRTHHIGGGLYLDTGPSDGNKYELRLVRVEMECETIALGVQKT